MAMSGMRQVAVGVGAIDRTPPDAVLREGVPRLLESVPEHRRMAAVELAHWGYGATAGAAFALLPAGLRRSRLTGPLYGVAVWGLFEVGVAPLLGLAHAYGSRPRERWALLVDHVVFGLVVGAPPEASVTGSGEPDADGSPDGSPDGEPREDGPGTTGPEDRSGA
ncbi:hypothetical protein ACFWTE_15120 [Nocardiopsis sp. NPDC058631]|uniref:hypothetical protein n=1 Tax=Nocardiopsis sp. NPDC058631 TaxID=3346566 RepID=UPI003653B917